MRLFARSVEGISSMDKLDDAGLVSYMDDGNIHVNPRRSTAFYSYLRKLYRLLPTPEARADRPGHNGPTASVGSQTRTELRVGHLLNAKV